uniref:RNA-binding protein NOB1 n=1 Tax=Kryptolebias marmoratus TaxID=37003 RepID=A0A3Q3B6G7_KRYMA
MAQALVEHVVADAGAFLKKAPLQDIGKNIYTLRDVVDEIRDKPTRRSLAFLPYQLHFKEPHPENIRHVTEFSKKTGDYPSLSATDVKVLALTYQLELEHIGTQHLKTEPEIKVNIQSTQRHPEAPVNITGFHFPSKVQDGWWMNLQTEKESSNQSDSEQFNSFQFWREPLPSIDTDLLDLLVRSGKPAVRLDLQVENKPEEEKDDEDDGGGWITPGNIRLVKMDSADWTAPADIRVGCLTTDFAMQNVLIQMGLHVLSVNGMVIRQARNYILRCHACFKTTSNMNRVFCSHCGNRTLKKLAVTVSDDGSIQMHFSKNPKVLNPRGLRHSLPLPHGGKHANNPHLVEDQRFPQQRLSRKARQKTDVFDPDYMAESSPFCENDIYSRAANLQIRDTQSGGGRRRANPNTSRKKFVKKK